MFARIGPETDHSSGELAWCHSDIDVNLTSTLEQGRINTLNHVKEESN